MLEMGMPGCVEDEYDRGGKDSLETVHIFRNELQAFAQKELKSQLADLRAKLGEDLRAALFELQHFSYSNAPPLFTPTSLPERPQSVPVVGNDARKKASRKIPPMRLLDAPWRLPDSEELSLEGRLAFLAEAREAAGRGPIIVKPNQGRFLEANGRPASKERGDTSLFPSKNDMVVAKEIDDDLTPKLEQLRLAAFDERSTNGLKHAPIQQPELNNPNPPAEPCKTLEVQDMETSPPRKISDSSALKVVDTQVGEPLLDEAEVFQMPEQSLSKYPNADSRQMQAPRRPKSFLTPESAHKSSQLASSADTIRQAYMAKRDKSRIHHHEDTKLFFTHVKSHINRKSQANRISAAPPPPTDKSCWQKFGKCCGKYADYPVAFAIFLNGIFLGVQTQYQSSNMTQAVPPIYPVFEVVFCLIFTTELLFRLARHGYKFFINKGWKWNIFDFLLVMMQLIEVAGMFTTQHESKSAPPTANVSYLRLLRILRLFRVLRLFRLLQFIGELNTIISSIMNSMRPLFWTMILLLLMIYVVGIVFTQIVFNHRMTKIESEDLSNDATMQDLEYWFGTLWRSILSLYEAILGGVDWDSLVHPLVVEISVFAAPTFMFYVAFVLLAMMNVITGIFVESALKNASKEQEMEFYSAAKELFRKGNLSRGFSVTRAHFLEELAQSTLQSYLRQVNIERQDAELMFKILDVDNCGEIDLDDLLAGLLRLRSSAKVFDIALFMHE